MKVLGFGCALTASLRPGGAYRQRDCAAGLHRRDCAAGVHWRDCAAGVHRRD